MKAEHRKELETNILAQQLGKAYEGLKQGPSRTTLFYVGAAVAVVLVIVLFRYFMSSSERDASKRWRELDEVVFPDQLETYLAQADVKDTTQGKVARYREARLELAQGLRDLGVHRQGATDRIHSATKTYDELARSAGKVPLLHQEALSGAAKGYEALGDFETARARYKRLADDYPTSALGKDAKAAIDRLDNSNNQADLAELKKAFSETRTGRSE
jgi:hypothetical protein